MLNEKLKKQINIYEMHSTAFFRLETFSFNLLCFMFWIEIFFLRIIYKLIIILGNIIFQYIDTNTFFSEHIV